MANPKHKISKSRRGMRRSHNALFRPSLSACPECSEARLPHRACPNCGYYRGRKVVEIK